MAAAQPILVVRNTFLDVEDHDEEEAPEVRSSSKRSSSAPRSWKPTTVDDSPVASTAASTASSDDEADGEQATDACSGGVAPGPAALQWADAEDDSDEEFFAKMPRRWSSLPGCAGPPECSARPLAYDCALLPVPCWKPSGFSMPVTLGMSAEQQAAVVVALPITAATPCARTPLRTKLSGSAESFSPSQTSSMAMAVAPFGTQAAPVVQGGAAPLPATTPRKPTRTQAVIDLTTLPELDDEFGDLLAASRALRGGRAQRPSREHKREKWQQRRDKKRALLDVSPAVGMAISGTEGVVSVAVTKSANETSFVVQVRPGHPQVADAVLRTAKAAVMNAAALSTDTYVVGYLGQPFEERPRGFKASFGVVQQCDEAYACWGFYEHGSCPCSSTCHRQHPREDELEHIAVTVIA